LEVDTPPPTTTTPLPPTPPTPSENCLHYPFDRNMGGFQKKANSFLFMESNSYSSIAQPIT
jgi:hypothetical protein